MHCVLRRRLRVIFSFVGDKGPDPEVHSLPGYGGRGEERASARIFLTVMQWVRVPAARTQLQCCPTCVCCDSAIKGVVDPTAFDTRHQLHQVCSPTPEFNPGSAFLKFQHHDADGLCAVLMLIGSDVSSRKQKMPLFW